MSPLSTMTPAIITAMRGAAGFAFADRGVHRPPSAPRHGCSHDTRQDQQDPDRLPRPMERLPRRAVRLRHRRQRVRAPSEATQDTSVHSLVGTAARTPFAHVPSPAFEMPRA